MKALRFLVPVPAASLLLAAALLPAQTQLVRGDIDSISQSNRFRLDCTNIQLVTSTVNLQQLHDASKQQDIEYELQVRDVSQPGQAILDVLSARPIAEMFDMGNIRFGRADTWEVFGPAGSTAAIFVTTPSFTSYGPFGAAGTWLLGANAVLFAHGPVASNGRYQLRYQPPTIPSLIGLTVVGQALLIQNGVLTLTNPDCRDVRSS
jgi:hypothetical protein